MAEQDLKRKLATIMVADIVGFSRLTANDEDGTIRALAEFRGVVDDIIARHDGRIFNTGGDSVLAEFASPVEAVRCAVDFQEAARSRNLLQPRDRQLRFRIGINLGDVMVRGADLLGDGVNVAARLEALAEPGGICVSGTVWDQIQGKLSIGYVDIGEQSVKNIPRPIHAYHLRVDGSTEEILAPASAAGSAHAPIVSAAPPPSERKRNLLVPTLVAALVLVIVGGGGAVWTLWPHPRARVAHVPEKRTAEAPAATTTAAAPRGNEVPAPALPLPQALSTRLAAVVPGLSEGVREEATRTYVNGLIHKAKAVSLDPPAHWSAYDRATAENAAESALEGCQVFYGHPCALVVVDDVVQPAPADGKMPVRDMPRVGYSGDFDPTQIPSSADGLRKRSDIAGYAGREGPKAAAYHPAFVRMFVVTKASSQHAAEEEALKTCNDDTAARKWTGPCFLYAVNNRVVLPLRLTEPLTSATAAAVGAPPAPATPFLQSLAARLAMVSPGLSEKSREGAVRDYANSPAHKAQAVSIDPAGYWTTWSRPDSEDAAAITLEGCQVFHGHPCVLVATDEALQPLSPNGKSLPRDMPRVAYAGNFDPAQIPGAGDALRKRNDVINYAAAAGPKAASFHPVRARMFLVTQAASQRAAEADALKTCNDDTAGKGFHGPCFLYAAGNRVVLPLRLKDPLTAAAK